LSAFLPMPTPSHPTVPSAWADPFAPDELAGRACLITGAAQGIGGAIATALAEHGALVAVTDLNLAGAQAKTDELRAAGLQAAPFALDVRDTAAIDATVEAAEAELGPLDVLVNNAGLFVLTESVDVPDDEWQLQIDVMLTGPFKLARRAARGMLARRRGAIVSICSIGGFGGHPQRSAYNAAKGGVKVLTEVLATEWAPHGVRVNAVAPAVTRTEILTNVIESAGGAIRVDEYEGRTPMGRIAEAREIADGVVFLASDRAAYVTGQTLPIDGGWLASDGFPTEPGGDRG
jgi:NAD(P)-dependent dehydrogenase (short-subunit alcohol dehydrogenase family)